MIGWLKIRTPREMLIRDGIDPETAWEDDPGLTKRQRARLRSIGRSVYYRRRAERLAGEREPSEGPQTNGMGEDGGQR